MSVQMHVQYLTSEDRLPVHPLAAAHGEGAQSELTPPLSLSCFSVDGTDVEMKCANHEMTAGTGISDTEEGKA
jgi:hypothetical protein